MKSFDEFSEDLETRRQLLKQRQTDQAASFKEKGAANVDAQRNRVAAAKEKQADVQSRICLLYTSPSPRDRTRSRMPSSA